jgi:hypothetical protein
VLEDFDNSGIKYIIEESHGNVESFYKKAVKDTMNQSPWNYNEIKE